jgi:hypothetical protein
MPASRAALSVAQKSKRGESDTAALDEATVAAALQSPEIVCRRKWHGCAQHALKESSNVSSAATSGKKATLPDAQRVLRA